VPTPENFGKSGEPPTHRELLDWLAEELVGSGWSRKALIRTIALSATYRQSSVHRKDLARSDPDNHLLARQNRVRVEAEIVRDLALASAGLLKPNLVGGPSIVPPYPDDFRTGQFSAEALKKPGGDRHRRSVYIHTQRTLTHPTLAAFDAADGNQPCVRRARATTPVQALTLLNDPTFRECAVALGARLISASKQREERLRLGFRLCLGRAPALREMAVLTDLVKTLEKLRAKEPQVWTGVARTLLNLEGFVTRE